MTNSNYPARQQGTTISRKLHYTDFQQVRDVCYQLREQGMFRHASPADVDERGSFVVITYVDPAIVSTRRAAAPSTAVARVQPQRLAIAQRPTSVPRPVHKRWWFVPSIVLATLTVMCAAGYWGAQQLKQMSAPDIGAGAIGFLFVIVLIVAIIKKISGGGGGGHSGGHGFHYGPCK